MPDGESVVGETLRISPGADAITHTFQALLSLPVGEYNVFPGTLVKVAFVSGEDESILLPAAAIARRGEVTAVYVIKPNDILEFRYLRLGTETAEALVPVLAGLLPGEKIALDPILAAKAYRQKFEQNKPSTHE